ncbi:hypothetical protein ACM26W_04085 [Halomonas sp. HK25]|uniref:hypothetical protein n=1 Tax=Halomonas sp. HK25 TaxID=3394321 RepID=UPI0039FDAA47
MDGLRDPGDVPLPGGHPAPSPLPHLLPHADRLEKVTVLPRGRTLGVTTQVPDEERVNYNESYLHDRLTVMFGGRLAESIVFGEVSSGAENDLEHQAAVLAHHHGTPLVLEGGLAHGQAVAAAQARLQLGIAFPHGGHLRLGEDDGQRHVAPSRTQLGEAPGVVAGDAPLAVGLVEQRQRLIGVAGDEHMAGPSSALWHCRVKRLKRGTPLSSIDRPAFSRSSRSTLGRGL